MTRTQTDVDRRDQSPVEGWPFFVFESLVVVVGFVGVLKSNTLFLGPARLALLVVLVLAHLVLLWLSPRFMHSRRDLWIYMALQATFALGVALLSPGHWLAIALYMGLTGLAVSTFWPDLRVIAVVLLISLCLSVYHLAVSWGWSELAQLLPTLGAILAFVVIYVVLFTRQTQAREQAQELLRELETAHSQLQEYADRVEELTISQERQRMAQELHDTLAQGVAGLILQLEAADSHLESGNAPRAQETVQRAMALARTTLREARRAIQALRPAELEGETLIDALGHAVDEFAAKTGIHATFQVDAVAPGRPSGALPEVPLAAEPEILRIAQESLANVARHAQAENVWIQLGARGERLRLTVQDDGRGFDLDPAAGRPGAYGIRGMKERAAAIGGELEVRSAPGKGTTVILEMEAQP